jgi:hypothetical protein
VSLAGGDVFINASTNRVGIGTSTPVDDLEIQSIQPSMIFDDVSGASTDWYLGNVDNDFVFYTQDNGTGGPAYTNIMTLDAQTGFVGIGAATPTAGLHLWRSDENAKILVEENNGSQAPRTLFEIKNNGNPEFTMTNSGNSNSWRFSAGLNFVVKSDSGLRVSVLSPTGDLTILGSIFTAGGSCGGGCDLLFDPETEIESIDEHATQMWANSYLPAVGPTVENAPMNLTEKTGGMLNELEKAHIYIEQLYIRNLSLEQRANESEQRADEMERRVHELEQQNQRIEELVMRMVQSEQVAMN